MKHSLKGLPAPTNEVEILMPELEQDEPQGEAPLEEDAADAVRRREQQEQDRLEAERLRQTQAVQRNLPRPVAPQLMVSPLPEVQADGSTDAERAEALLF